ncbi:hypothetical protein [Flavobacterium sp.]|uniref:hypothetical protein n=1 Tax=Flavobacterium sp. TaxID=239 RepID=UPI002619AA3C|nr:hypothetical protein [Flavobacterium sp.]
MKNFITISLLLFISCISSSFTAQEKFKLKTGFYYLAEKESDGELIKDADTKDIFAVGREAVLTSDDFSSVKIVSKDFKPNSLKGIEVKLTKKGRTKWFDIKKRISQSGESILFICQDKVYLEKSISGKIEFKESEILILLDPKHQQTIYDILKSEISNSH